jgi:hypothetical protein
MFKYIFILAVGVAIGYGYDLGHSAEKGASNGDAPYPARALQLSTGSKKTPIRRESERSSTRSFSILPRLSPRHFDDPNVFALAIFINYVSTIGRPTWLVIPMLPFREANPFAARCGHDVQR